MLRFESMTQSAGFQDTTLTGDDDDDDDDDDDIVVVVNDKNNDTDDDDSDDDYDDDVMMMTMMMHNIDCRSSSSCVCHLFNVMVIRKSKFYSLINSYNCHYQHYLPHSLSIIHHLYTLHSYIESLYRAPIALTISQDLWKSGV